MPSDDVDDSKVVEDVHAYSEISSIIEGTSIDPCPSIHNEIPMFSAITSDVMNTLVDSSKFTPAEIYIYEENQESQETRIESITGTPSMTYSSESLEFLAIL